MYGFRGSDSGFDDCCRVSEAQTVDLMTVARFQHVYMHGFRGSDSDGCMVSEAQTMDLMAVAWIQRRRQWI
jgi:hypothetical protein